VILDAGNGERLASVSGLFADIQWEPGGERLLAVRSSGSPALLAVVPSRAPETVEALAPWLSRPALSPDGLALAGLGEVGANGLPAAVIRERGGRVRVEGFASAHVDLGAPAWSPDGGRVALVGTGNTPRDGGIVVADALTGQVLRSVTPRGGALGSTGVFSPSGNELAYSPAAVRRRRPLPQIRLRMGVNVLNISTGRVRALGGTHRGRWFFGAAWSPDGRAIVTGDSRRRLTRVTLATGRVRVLRTLRARPHTLTYSPDGRALAFGTGSREVAVLAGGRARRVTVLARGEALTGLEWSPDGRRLALSVVDTGG
jgi:Tol biopolymer transport system component